MAAANKYAKCIIEETPAPPLHPRPANPAETGGTNVIYINDELQGAVPNATYLDIALVTRPFSMGPFRRHAHSFDEYVTFIGTNIENPCDLGGVVEFWIEDEKYILTKTCTVFVPKGTFHLPFVFHEVDSPIIFMASSGATHNPSYLSEPVEPAPEGFGVATAKGAAHMSGEKKYAKYILDNTPDSPQSPRPANPKEAGGTNVIYVNNELNGTLPNATYLDIGLVTKPFSMPFQQHAHSVDEYIAFIGTNIEKPYELDGVVEFWIEDEKYILTKTCAVFVPKGTYHCPFVFHEVNSPIVFMSTSPGTHLEYPRDAVLPPPEGFGVV
ncbi:MAG: cupin domain-containing protein [Actinobacteria bacterium]|nr:cupin domain-containing protein [Actinomycetota bacterium]